MNKLNQSIEMFKSMQMSGVGINNIEYKNDNGGELIVDLDVFSILELRSQTELFDQKFGKFILDYVEDSSLKLDKHQFSDLLKHNAK
jgi:hypothetical protein